MRQAAILAAASLFVRFMGFAYRTPLTNLIGDDGIGFYSIAYNVYAFGIVLSSGTLPAALSKMVSERLARRQYGSAHKLFKTALLFSMSVGVVVGAVMGFGADVIANVFNAPDTAPAIRTLAPTIFVVSVLTVFRGYFQGMKTAVPTAISQVVEQIFNVAFSLWLAFLLHDTLNPHRAVAGATAGTGIAALAALGTLLFLYSFIAKDLRTMANNDLKTRENRRTQIWEIVRTSLPMIIGTGMFSFAFLMDLQMASGRLLASGAFSEQQVNELIGQFTGKFILLTTLPVSLSLALSSAVIPEIASSRVLMDTQAVKQKTNMALRISMILAIPSAIGLAVLAYPIIALLFPRFPDGGWLLQFGAVSIVFLSLNHVLTGALQGLGHIKLPIFAALFGVIAKVPINYVLVGIPSINILGVVVSTIVCYIVAAAINIFFLYKKTGILPSFSGAFIKPALASAGMGLVCYITYHTLAYIAPMQIATIVALFTGMVAYLLFMCLIKGFKQRDLQVLPLPRKLRGWMARF